MSSNYYLLCLNHDPAITIAGPFNDAEVPLRRVVERAGEGLSEHTECDLLIGKYSGALVEICCPGGVRPYQHEHQHPRPEWVDADWLRLLLAVQREQLSEEARKHVAKFAAFCWYQRRVIRLRHELGIEVPGAT